MQGKEETRGDTNGTSPHRTTETRWCTLHSALCEPRGCCNFEHKWPLGGEQTTITIMASPSNPPSIGVKAIEEEDKQVFNYLAKKGYTEAKRVFEKEVQARVCATQYKQVSKRTCALPAQALRCTKCALHLFTTCTSTHMLISVALLVQHNTPFETHFYASYTRTHQLHAH